MTDAALVLEDGKIFYGKGFGSARESVGEVVFNTGMTGYQEILTDPSYAGQIVVMTYPLIGNYGTNGEDEESGGIKAKGFIVREYCEIPGSWRNTGTLESYMVKNGIPGICGIDTRALTRYLRSRGVMKGVISKDFSSLESLMGRIKAMDYDKECSPLSVGTKVSYRIPGYGSKVAVLDFGIKSNILRYLKDKGCDIMVLPGDSGFEAVMGTGCDGVLLSNGPGDPKALPGVVDTVKKLINVKPVFGICLGHQLLGLALGADTYKLPYGHRGANHPVKDHLSGRVYITSQNHGFALDRNTIDLAELEITHTNLNDNTVEGIRHRFLPLFSVQYHPEAAPGPQDSNYLFEQFILNMMGSKAA